MKPPIQIWIDFTSASRLEIEMWIERKRERKRDRPLFGKSTMLHASSRVPSHPTMLEFLNVIFLFCLHSLYERNFYLLSFPEPRLSCLPHAFYVAPTFPMPFFSLSLCGRSRNISFLSFLLFLSLASFLGVRAAVRTSLQTFMISRCVASILPLCFACPFFLSQRSVSFVGWNRWRRYVSNLQVKRSQPR